VGGEFGRGKKGNHIFPLTTDPEGLPETVWTATTRRGGDHDVKRPTGGPKKKPERRGTAVVAGKKSVSKFRGTSIINFQLTVHRAVVGVVVFPVTDPIGELRGKGDVIRDVI